MGKKKESENLAKELADTFERWEYLKEHGGSDPFYADGGSMNLERNHIIYYNVDHQIICTYFCQIILTQFCHIPLVHAY